MGYYQVFYLVPVCDGDHICVCAGQGLVWCGVVKIIGFLCMGFWFMQPIRRLEGSSS